MKTINLKHYPLHPAHSFC